MAHDGTHGAPAHAEQKGGGPSAWDLKMIRLRRESLTAWEQRHAESVARIEAIRAEGAATVAAGALCK